MKVCLACADRFNHIDWNCPKCGSMPVSIDGHLSFSPEMAAVSEGYEAVFFAELSSLEAKNFWFRSRNHLIIWALKRYFPKAQTFLEVGCGTGFVLSGIEQACPQLALFGSEVFVTGLRFAAKRLSKAALFQMDARKIPFVDEFDVIGAFDVIEHIQQDVEVLKQMHQAIQPGGGMILTVPQHPWLWSQFDDIGHHVRRYRAQELKTKVEQAGFKVLRMTSFVSLLLPLMLLSRLRSRKVNSNYDVMAELKVSRWMNTMLEGILTLERAVIQRGGGFPAGGSLLLIAQKL